MGRVPLAFGDLAHYKYTWWHISDLDCAELRRDFGENTDSECEAGRKSEEASFVLIFVF